MGWTSSRHAASGVLCSDCHATHDRELFLVRPVGTLGASMLPSAGTITRMCSSCHAEVVARFDLPSHHPMREGMLECTDCHEAHGETSISLGPDTRMCTSCHQEVAGPWVYEHGSHTVIVGEPGTDNMKTLLGMAPLPRGVERTRVVNFSN